MHFVFFLSVSLRGVVTTDLGGKKLKNFLCKEIQSHTADLWDIARFSTYVSYRSINVGLVDECCHTCDASFGHILDGIGLRDHLSQRYLIPEVTYPRDNLLQRKLISEKTYLKR